MRESQPVMKPLRWLALCLCAALLAAACTTGTRHPPHWEHLPPPVYGDD